MNRLNNKLSVVSANVKGQLLQTYCCSWYGCRTLDLVSKLAQTNAVEWNEAVRHTLGIPYTTHTVLLPGITGSKPFKEQHTSRVFKLISSFFSSHNDYVLLIGERARFCAVGALGRNWDRRAMADIAAPPCADSLARTQVIRELLDLRDGVTSMPDFSNDDITLLIDYMCCSWVKRRTPVNLVLVGSFNLQRRRVINCACLFPLTHLLYCTCNYVRINDIYSDASLNLITIAHRSHICPPYTVVSI